MANEAIDFEKAFRLICELDDTRQDYRNHVLNLLAKYYGYNHMSFLSTNAPVAGSKPLVAQKPYYYGFSDQAIHDYGYKYFHLSPFQKYNMPDELYVNAVVSKQDIAEYAENRVEYCEFLYKNRFHDHLCIYLRSDDTVLGCICIYKDDDSTPFSEIDKNTMRMQAEYIARHYSRSIELSTNAFQKALYKNCFDSMETGIVILDTDYTIMGHNYAADRYCRQIAECEEGHMQNAVQSILHCIRAKADKEFFLETKSESLSITIDTTIVPMEFYDPRPLIMIRIEGMPLANYHTLAQAYRLTSRETEIYQLLEQGLSNEKIAEILNISANTSKTHVKNIFAKADVANRTELVYKFNKANGQKRLPI